MSEEWKGRGLCVACRKSAYCTKRCRAFREHVRENLAIAVRHEMLRRGIPAAEALRIVMDRGRGSQEGGVDE